MLGYFVRIKTTPQEVISLMGVGTMCVFWLSGPGRRKDERSFHLVFWSRNHIYYVKGLILLPKYGFEV